MFQEMEWELYLGCSGAIISFHCKSYCALLSLVIIMEEMHLLVLPEKARKT